MNWHLYYTLIYKKHDLLLRSYQFGGTASLSTGDLIGRKISANNNEKGLG